MNKVDFLKKLSRMLHMLKESEVKDILDEYEQHIDMKVAEGMTEEEAIAAFGSIEELAEEILDAYHVKADFKESKSKEMFEKVQQESKKVMQNAGEAGKGFFGNCIQKGKQICKKFFSFVKKAGSAVKNLICSPFLFLKEKLENRRMKKEEFMETGEVRRQWNIGRGIAALLKAILRLIKKFCYGVLFFMTGLTGTCLILTAGLLFVIMLLGYPVIGITVAVIGMAMTMNSVAYFAAMKWRRV